MGLNFDACSLGFFRGISSTSKMLSVLKEVLVVRFERRDSVGEPLSRYDTGMGGS
jgi:hypothetical protein